MSFDAERHLCAAWRQAAPTVGHQVNNCGWSGQEWAASENAIREGYEHASAGLTDRLLAALGRARPEPEKKP